MKSQRTTTCIVHCSEFPNQKILAAEQWVLSFLLSSFSRNETIRKTVSSK